jgi:cell division protein FtsB
MPRRAVPRAVAAPAPAAEARRPRFTGRAAILVLVVAVLTVSYASSLRAYLQQRSHIEDLKSQIALRQASIHDLEREKERWQDPAFVRQQARELNYVMPGETSYVVLDENGEPLEKNSELTDPSTVARKPPTAWWSTAWQSVEIAGNPPKPEPPPASKIDEKKIDGSGG